MRTHSRSPAYVHEVSPMRIWFVLLLCLVTSCTAMGAEVGAFSDAGTDGDFRSASGLAAAEPSAAKFDAPEAADESAAAQDGAQPPARQVIYSAMLRLVVVSADQAQRSIQTFAEAANGHMQESDARSITVRVPAAAFADVLARIASLGEVVDRSVKASDVTEQMLDLDIRLENARKTRDRLLEHLSKSTKIEDTLAIEAQLARVSVEIEQMEGKRRYLQSQIAMSTIRVELNVVARGSGGSAATASGVPFAWIDALGDGLVAGAVEGLPRKPGIFSGGPRFDPPAEFIRYYSKDTLVEAMNAEGVRIKLQEHANFDKGALAFWTKLARKALVRNRALAQLSERDLGADGTLITGSREVAGAEAGYLLVISRTNESVYTFEAWGPKAEFDAQREKLLASAASLRR